MLRESGLRYRGYVIYHDGFEFVAEEEVQIPDETVVFEMGSQSLDRLVISIDELTDAADSKGILPVPDWYMNWYADWALVGDKARLSLPVPVRQRLQQEPDVAPQPEKTATPIQDRIAAAARARAEREARAAVVPETSRPRQPTFASLMADDAEGGGASSLIGAETGSHRLLLGTNKTLHEMIPWGAEPIPSKGLVEAGADPGRVVAEAHRTRLQWVADALSRVIEALPLKMSGFEDAYPDARPAYFGDSAAYAVMRRPRSSY